MTAGTREARFLPILALAAALILSAPPAAAQSGGQPHRNITARDFMNTFGVNVHFGDNAYRNTQAIADALNIIGFSRVRMKCIDAADVAAGKDLAAKTKAYFPAGLKADVLVIGYLNARNVDFASQQKTIPQMAGMIETIEGPNEINNYAVGDGTHGPFSPADQTRNFSVNYAAWAKAIFAWKQKTPSLSSVTLMAPTIASGDPADYGRLPDISPDIGLGNFHFYAGAGRQPSGFGGGNFSALCDWYRAAAAPAKPAAVSEWGQTTAGRRGQGGCDDATQAKYILNQLFDIAAKHIHRAYLYQLMDDTPDGDPTGEEGSEAHFGIFDYQWHPKPAAQALANVKKLLSDTPRRFIPKVPAYRVSGVTDAGASGSSLSVSKSDGSTFLVVWNEPRIWDAKTNAAIAPLPDRITIDFGGRYSYKVYDPLVGIGAVASGRALRVEVTLNGSPLMVQIAPQQQPVSKLVNE